MTSMTERPIVVAERGSLDGDLDQFNVILLEVGSPHPHVSMIDGKVFVFTEEGSITDDLDFAQVVSVNKGSPYPHVVVATS